MFLFPPSNPCRSPSFHFHEKTIRHCLAIHLHPCTSSPVFGSAQALKTSSRSFGIAIPYLLFLSKFLNSLLGHSGLVRCTLPVGAIFAFACLRTAFANRSIRSWDHDVRQQMSSRPQQRLSGRPYPPAQLGVTFYLIPQTPCRPSPRHSRSA